MGSYSPRTTDVCMLVANAKLVTFFAVCKSDQMMFAFLVNSPPNSTNVFVIWLIITQTFNHQQSITWMRMLLTMIKIPLSDCKTNQRRQVAPKPTLPTPSNSIAVTTTRVGGMLTVLTLRKKVLTELGSFVICCDKFWGTMHLPVWRVTCNILPKSFN